MHKAEASRGGEGRCLLLFRLKEMFWKLKVISSQAFVTELHSCQLAFADMQHPCLRRLQGRSSTGWEPALPQLSQGLHPKGLSRQEVPDLPPSQKPQDQLGSASRVIRIRGECSDSKYWFFSVSATHLTKNIAHLKANVNVSLWQKYPL